MESRSAQPATSSAELSWGCWQAKSSDAEDPAARGGSAACPLDLVEQQARAQVGIGQRMQRLGGGRRVAEVQPNLGPGQTRRQEPRSHDHRRFERAACADEIAGPRARPRQRVQRLRGPGRVRDGGLGRGKRRDRLAGGDPQKHARRRRVGRGPLVAATPAVSLRRDLGHVLGERLTTVDGQQRPRERERRPRAVVLAVGEHQPARQHLGAPEPGARAAVDLPEQSSPHRLRLPPPLPPHEHRERHRNPEQDREGDRRLAYHSLS